MAEDGLFGGGETDPPDELDGLGWEGWSILLALPAGLAAALFLILAQGVHMVSVDVVSGVGVGTPAMDPSRLAIGLGLAVVFLVTALFLARHQDEG